MQSLVPLAIYAFVASITPGPNNLMLTSSGLRFGFARTIPHILGITGGFCTLLALCALGVGQLMIAVPGVEIGLKVVGSLYMLWLAWGLKNLTLSKDSKNLGAPMSFFSAWLFQFVNPKCWVMAISSVSAFLPPIEPVSLAILVFCLVFSVVNVVCISVWACTGAALREKLQRPSWQKAFGGSMAVLTVYAAVAMW